MATINFTGFETGDSIETSATSGTFSIQNSVVRTGTYALRVNPTTSGTGFIRMNKIIADGTNSDTTVTTFYARFYFRYAVKPASNFELLAVIGSASTVKMRIALNSGGNIALYTGGGTATLVATGSTVLAQDTWYRLETYAINSSSGAYEFRIDGNVELSGASGFDYGVNDPARIILGKQANFNNNTVDFFYDDFMSSDSGFPGAGQAKVMLPNANGNYQTWTVGAGSGSHYLIVNEVPPDGDTSYLLSTGVLTNAETEALQDSGTVGITGTVNSVKAITVNKQNSSAGNLIVRLRSSSTDSNTTGAATGATYAVLSKLSDTDPATSGAWGVSALDSIESGAVENALVNTSRMTFTAAMVDYTPSTAVTRSFGYIIG